MMELVREIKALRAGATMLLLLALPLIVGAALSNEMKTVKFMTQ